MTLIIEPEQRGSHQGSAAQIKRALGLFGRQSLRPRLSLVLRQRAEIDDGKIETKLRRDDLMRLSIVRSKSRPERFVASQDFNQALFEGRNIKGANQPDRGRDIVKRVVG